MISPSQRSGTTISTIFNVCLSAIGGNPNPDVQRYYDLRNQEITRTAFLAEAVWIVWVTGMGRKATRTFLDTVGFNYTFQSFASLNPGNLDAFVRRAHPFGVTPRAKKKWLAVHAIASWLNAFPSEISFRQTVFAGKSKGDQLDTTDVHRILGLNLPFIGSANSHYMVKNLGGQAIKPDRWINEFLFWGNLDQPQLESRLKQQNIPLSLFDTVIWSYCEMFIRRTADLDTHFTAKFGLLV